MNIKVIDKINELSQEGYDTVNGIYHAILKPIIEYLQENNTNQVIFDFIGLDYTNVRVIQLVWYVITQFDSNIIKQTKFRNLPHDEFFDFVTMELNRREANFEMLQDLHDANANDTNHLVDMFEVNNSCIEK